MRHLSPSLLVLGLGACTAGSDIDGTTTGSTFEPPDITGTYDATWVGAGCEAFADAPLDWVTGELVISGQPDALTWDFTEASLAGSVDATFAFELGGDFADLGAAVESAGTAFLDGDRWGLDGDLTLSWVDPADEARSCQADGALTAAQRVE